MPILFARAFGHVYVVHDFISTFPWLYCSQCRYAPLFYIIIFVIVCLLHFILPDRKVFWICREVREMIQSDQVEMTEERERVEAFLGESIFSALCR